MRLLAPALALTFLLPGALQAAEPPPDAQIAALAERIRALEANAQMLQSQAAEALAAAQAAQAELQLSLIHI